MYIVVDYDGREMIFSSMPERNVRINSHGIMIGRWKTLDGLYKCDLPNGTIKLFYDNNRIIDAPDYLSKRDMCWGDNPLLLKQ